MRKFKNRAISILLVIATVIALLMMVPSILGFDRYAISSGSMSPTIDKGSVVYAKPKSASELRVGDIITYRPPPDSGVTELVTHRIHTIQHPTSAGGRPVFTTKGDANKAPDPWQFELDSGEAAREEAHLPFLGYIHLAMAVPWVRLVVILLPALLILVLTLVSLWVEAGREAEQERRSRAGRGVPQAVADGGPA
jgi:signal peptidase I